jgi:hypothetical protein
VANDSRREDLTRFSLKPTSHNEYGTTLSRTLLLSIFAMLLFASPAAAQEEEPILTSPKDAGKGERYEVFKDGTFVIGGDVVGHCSAVLQEAQQTGTAPSPEILRQVEVCTKAGFPPRGSASLPDTGGPPFLTVAGALLLGTCALGFLERVTNFSIRRR